jgi:hypothetical protein
VADLGGDDDFVFYDEDGDGCRHGGFVVKLSVLGRYAGQIIAFYSPFWG